MVPLVLRVLLSLLLLRQVITASPCARSDQPIRAIYGLVLVAAVVADVVNDAGGGGGGSHTLKNIPMLAMANVRSCWLHRNNASITVMKWLTLVITAAAGLV